MMRIILLLLMFNLYSCSENTSDHETEKSVISINTVQASGEIISAKNIIIRPPQIKRMRRFTITQMAPEGRVIKKGKTLISFDDSQLKQTLKSKQNKLQTDKKKLENIHLDNEAKSEELKLKLAEAKMNLEKAELKWQQSKGLESIIETKKLALLHQIAIDDVLKYERTISKNNQTSKVKVISREYEVAHMEKEVQDYAESIKRMKVKAPKTGVVVYKSDRRSEKHSVGDTVWMGRQLIEIPSTDDLIIKAEILEADAGRVTVGQDVEIILDAASDRVYQGKVENLGAVFRRKSTDQPNIIFDAEITINKIDAEIMRPGMAVRLKIFSTSIPSVPYKG